MGIQMHPVRDAVGTTLGEAMNPTKPQFSIFLAHGPYLDAELGVIRREVREWNEAGRGVAVRLVPSMGGEPGEANDPGHADAFALLLADRWRSSFASTDATRDPEAEYERARSALEAALAGDRTVRLTHVAVFLRDSASQTVSTLQEKQVAAFRRAVQQDTRLLGREFLTLEALASSFRMWLDTITGERPIVAEEVSGEDPLKEALRLANAGMLARAEAAFMLAVARPDHLRAFIEYGKYLRRRGRAPESCEMFERAISKARSLRDRATEAEAISNLALSHQALGRPDDARRLHETALKLAKLAGDQQGHADSLSGLARLDKARGEIARAFKLAKQSLQISRDAGDAAGVAAQFANIGLLHRRRGEYEQAEHWLRRALTLDEKLGRDEAVARNCGNLALVHRAKGDLDIASRLLTRAAEINSRLGCLAGLANDYANLGQLSSDRGDAALAQKYHESSRDLEEKLGRTEGLARSHHSLGMLAHERRDAAEAEHHWRLAAELFDRAGLVQDAARTRAALSAANAGLDPIVDARAFMPRS